MIFDKVLHIGDMAVHIVRKVRIRNIHEEHRTDNHRKENDYCRHPAKTNPPCNKKAQQAERKYGEHTHGYAQRRSLHHMGIQPGITPFVSHAERIMRPVPYPIERNQAIA